MATGSLMMGTLKGKLGETVAMRRNGKQVLRAYVSNPKNPNSQKQQVQRMVQSTAAQAYSAMKKICDHSFEGVQVGQKSMSYFMSKNMDMLRAGIQANADGSLVDASVDFVRKGVNSPVLNPYVIAKGTLNEVSIEELTVDLPANFDPVTSLVIAEAAGLDEVEAMSAFIQRNSGKLGDWFTFCFLCRVGGQSEGEQIYHRFAFIRYVVVEIPSGVNTVLTLVPSLTSEGAVTDSSVSGFSNTPGTDDNPSIFYLDMAEHLNNLSDEDAGMIPVAYAIIHSRQNVGGSWQRSNASFVIRNKEALKITYPGSFFDELATYSGQGQAKGEGAYVLNGGD